MGRQAHLTRLALGRSPFTDPLRDGEGKFVLGPHAYIYDDVGYEQQFDDRGHPRNPSSRAAARRQRRAQNDVLAAVGVVVRKDDETKSEWEKMKPADKQRLVIFENQSGRELKANDRVAGVIVTWAIRSLRNRILTFSSYSTIPLSTLLQWEFHSMGPRRLLAAGLPWFLVAAVPQMYRYYIRNPDVEEIVNYVNPDGFYGYVGVDSRILMQCIHAFVYALEFPLQTFSTLQTLQIIAPNMWIPFSSFIPFNRASPIWLPPLPHHVSFPSSAKFLLVCCCTPLITGAVRDYLHIQVGYRIYAMLRQSFIRAERPDKLSTRVSDEVDIIEETSIPGVGYRRSSDELSHARRSYGPKSFWGAFRIAFPALYGIINLISGDRMSRSRGRLSPHLNAQLQSHVRSAYRSRRRHCTQALVSGGMADIALRRDVVYSTFSDHELDPEEELVDPFVWADSTLADVEDLLSTSTLEPGDLFDLNAILQDDDSPAHTQHVRAVPEPSLALEALESDPVLIANGQTAVEPSINPQSTLESNETQRVAETRSPMINSSSIISGPASPSQGGEQAQSNSSSTNSRDRSQIAVGMGPPADSEVLTVQTGPLALGNGIQQPPTPTPGIERAESLTDPAPPPIRRVRRTTETDIHSIADRSSAQYQPIFTEMSQHMLHASTIAPMDRTEHRMTLLSTFAIDSFAWHASAVITSLVLLPVESLYLRSLAHWAMHSTSQLGTEADANTMARSLLFETSVANSFKAAFGNRFRLFRLGEWFGATPAIDGMSENHRIQYAGAIMLTIGLEAMVRGAIWYIGTQRALLRGSFFGWGKF